MSIFRASKMVKNIGRREGPPQCYMLGYSAERICVPNCAVQRQARVTSLCKHDVKLTYCYALRPVFGGCCAVSCKGCDVPCLDFFGDKRAEQDGVSFCPGPVACALLQLYVVLTRVAERVLALLPLMACGNVTEDACRDAFCKHCD